MNKDKIEKLKHEYIFGTPNPDGTISFCTLDELIKQYQVPSSSVYRKSAMEAWTKERKEYKSNVQKKISLEKTKQLTQQIEMPQNKIIESLDLILLKAIDILRNGKTTSRDLFTLSKTIIICNDYISMNGFEQDSSETDELFKKIMGMLEQIKKFRLENPEFKFKEI